MEAPDSPMLGVAPKVKLCRLLSAGALPGVRSVKAKLRER